MSTYASIVADVTLDAGAYAHLLTATTRQWLNETDPTDGITATGLPDGGMHLVLDGSSFRNLCRYLEADLLDCQKHGTVTGMVSIDCTDGDTWRSVTRYDGTTAISGTSGCLNAIVSAYTVELTQIGPVEHGLRVLTPVDPAAEPVELHGVSTSEICTCGGYLEDGDDYDYESPLCTTLMGR